MEPDVYEYGIFFNLVEGDELDDTVVAKTSVRVSGGWPIIIAQEEADGSCDVVLIENEVEYEQFIIALTSARAAVDLNANLTSSYDI